MSKQWGNGFHKGREKGFAVGAEAGGTAGEASIAEQAWHCVDSAIGAIEKGDDLRGLMLLRTLRFSLAAKCGRDTHQEIDSA